MKQETIKRNKKKTITSEEPANGARGPAARLSRRTMPSSRPPSSTCTPPAPTRPNPTLESVNAPPA
eukprot:2772918-Rhodomonas_salina.2